MKDWGVAPVLLINLEFISCRTVSLLISFPFIPLLISLIKTISFCYLSEDNGFKILTSPKEFPLNKLF